MGVRKFQVCIHLIVTSFSSFESPISIRLGFHIIKHSGVKNKLTQLVVGNLSDQQVLNVTFFEINNRFINEHLRY